MPDFTDTTQFPSFYELPATSTALAFATTAAPDEEWYLLAQIKENMTIMQPTLIVTDRKGVDFALLFEDRDKNLKSFKKSYTVVVPRARRTDREGDGEAQGGGAKKSIVRVEKGMGDQVKVISGRLARVLELGKLLGSGEVLGRKCGACGSSGGEDGQDQSQSRTTLSRCLGCGIAVYCSKECQALSWNQLDHKSNCKVLRAVDGMWPRVS